jgi:hypothetical protein
MSTDPMPPAPRIASGGLRATRPQAVGDTFGPSRPIECYARSGSVEIPAQMPVTKLKGEDVDQLRTKASLSHSRRTLLEAMQRLNFGCLENLRIEGGEPIFDAKLRIVKEIKLGGANGPRPELLQSDFVLRAEAIELFQHLNELGNGRVLIQVRGGLPCRVVIQQEDFAHGGRQTSEDSNA